MKAPPLQYAPGPAGHVAYQTLGTGPVDIVLCPVWTGPIQLLWEEPSVAHSLRRLATGRRLIVFDRCGVGASDPEDLSLDVGDAWARDEIAVLDHLGVQGAIAVSWNQTDSVQIRVSLDRPDLLSRMVLVNAPLSPLPTVDDVSEDVESNMWGETDTYLDIHAPSAIGDVAWIEWFDRCGRQGTGPRAAERFWHWLLANDPSALVDRISVPVDLVNADRGSAFDRRYPGAVERSATAAARLGLEARIVDSADTVCFSPQMSKFVDMIEQVLEPGRTRTTDRLLQAVCFTDIVSSTQRAAEFGDDAWRALLDRHDALCGEHVARNGGRLVKSTGDGHLSVFASPTHAVECARDLLADLDAAGLSSRAGIHLGEVEIRGDDVGGVAVHLASRVCGAALDGELWVSDTVRQTTLGGSARFEAAGVHTLKGIDGEWALHRVVAIG